MYIYFSISSLKSKTFQIKNVPQRERLVKILDFNLRRDHQKNFLMSVAKLKMTRKKLYFKTI